MLQTIAIGFLIMCEHSDSQCNHKQPVPSVLQTLDELDFERGIWTAALDDDATRVKHLLAKGTNVDMRDNAGYTALHYAARRGLSAMCRLLVAAGADVNAKTRAGQATPLHRAAMAGQAEVVQILMDAGADPNIPDAEGHTAADRTRANGHWSIAPLLLPSATPEHGEASLP